MAGEMLGSVVGLGYTCTNVQRAVKSHDAPDTPRIGRILNDDHAPRRHSADCSHCDGFIYQPEVIRGRPSKMWLHLHDSDWMDDPHQAGPSEKHQRTCLQCIAEALRAEDGDGDGDGMKHDEYEGREHASSSGDDERDDDDEGEDE